jgi:hypothetical protein
VALWLSSTTTKTITVIIDKIAVESLWHYQLKQPTNSLCASISSQLTDNKVTELKRLMETQNLQTVKLAFDADISSAPTLLPISHNPIRL